MPCRADLYLACFFLFATLFLACIPTGFEERLPAGSHHAKARILDVDNQFLKQHLVVKSGQQLLTVEILRGPYKGRTVEAVNHVTGKMELDEIYQPGEAILLEFSTKGGEVHVAQPRGTYRIDLIVLLVALFAGLLLAVGGWTGFKALLSFAFSVLLIWKGMVPLFLKGHHPIAVGLVIAGCLTAAISFLVGGLTRRGLATFLGSFAGLLLTCLLAQVFLSAFRIHGAVRPFAETLLYSGFYHLDLTALFAAGIFIASSGAVMDISMDIAASMEEVHRQQPGITLWDHIRSGLAVGRAVLGTMTTTLLLAYSGSYTAMLMLVMGKGVPLVNMININFVSAEILHTLVGSFGVVTVAPFTAVIAGLLYRGKPS